MPDPELVQQYKDHGDLQIISILLDRYVDVITGIAMRQLRDEEAVRDFANDMYLKLADKLATNEVSNFKSWLLTMVNNALTDLGRKARVRRDHREMVKATDNATPRGQLTPDLPLDSHLMGQALAALSAHERRCVELIYFQDFSYQEIMDAEGWTFNQVRGMRDRAMKKLREHLGPEFGAYFQED